MSSVPIYGDRAKYPDVYKTLEALANELNREGEPITFDVTVAGTEVAIPHKLNRIPTSALPVITEAVNGYGIIYPGTTSWDATNIYLTATDTGTYAVRVRR